MQVRDPQYSIPRFLELRNLLSTIRNRSIRCIVGRAVGNILHFEWIGLRIK